MSLQRHFHSLMILTILPKLYFHRSVVLHPHRSLQGIPFPAWCLHSWHKISAVGEYLSADTLDTMHVARNTEGLQGLQDNREH